MNVLEPSPEAAQSRVTEEGSELSAIPHGPLCRARPQEGAWCPPQAPPCPEGHWHSAPWRGLMHRDLPPLGPGW